MQVTDTILMVRPARFSYNPETAATNHFQQESALPASELQQQAATEFNVMVDCLRSNGIKVMVIDDTPEPSKPDAIFPNNWISTTAAGTICVFPMQAVSRRLEKRNDIIERLTALFDVRHVDDWSHFEKEELYLEGTGSLVIDHQHKIVYACLSPRTNHKVVEEFAAAHSCRAVTFTAHDERGREIYHTNVMLCIGEGFAVLCPEAITVQEERIAVVQSLEATGHENISITRRQMTSFAGNMLQVKNEKGDRFIVMSQTAFDSLEEETLLRLKQYGRLLPINVSTIEQVEGGSVRCMMAEIFLKEKRV